MRNGSEIVYPCIIESLDEKTKTNLKFKNQFKRFKEKEKFIKLDSQLGIHKNTIIFKINIFK